MLTPQAAEKGILILTLSVVSQFSSRFCKTFWLLPRRYSNTLSCNLRQQLPIRAVPGSRKGHNVVSRKTSAYPEGLLNQTNPWNKARTIPRLPGGLNTSSANVSRANLDVVQTEARGRAYSLDFVGDSGRYKTHLGPAVGDTTHIWSGRSEAPHSNRKSARSS